MDSNYSLSDVAAVTRGNDGFGFGDGGFFWIFALLLLPMMWGGGFGGWGNRGGQPVTEAGLCNAMNFNNLENAVGRGFDQQSQFAFQNQRDLCTSTATLSNQMGNGFSALERQFAECCCTTNRNIDQLRYDGAMNTSAIIQSQERGTQKVLDYLTGQENMRLRDENMRNYIQSQFCGVVRYPTATTYATGCNPFFGGYGYGGYGNNCG